VEVGEENKGKMHLVKHSYVKCCASETLAQISTEVFCFFSLQDENVALRKHG